MPLLRVQRIAALIKHKGIRQHTVGVAENDHGGQTQFPDKIHHMKEHGKPVLAGGGNKGGQVVTQNIAKPDVAEGKFLLNVPKLLLCQRLQQIGAVVHIDGILPNRGIGRPRIRFHPVRNGNRLFAALVDHSIGLKQGADALKGFRPGRHRLRQLRLSVFPVFLGGTTVLLPEGHIERTEIGETAFLRDGGDVFVRGQQ